MANDGMKTTAVPLTCHGHSRPVTHLSFSSSLPAEEGYYMISACKDNNPMLRDGITGDWIGTFFKHKGAVYQARLSSDASAAATASADFTARVWDTHSGTQTHHLKHGHIVRAVAFPPNSSLTLATGGNEKALRIWDLDHRSIDPSSDENTIEWQQAFEVGKDIHKGTIKAIVWTTDPNVLVTAADDKMVRWWDLRNQTVLHEFSVQGEIGSCEFTNFSSPVDTDTKDIIGSGNAVLCIAAGNAVYFFGGTHARSLLKSINLGYEVASVALHPQQRKFVVGAKGDTWVKVYDYDSGKEIDINKGHHGPVWSISFSPDGKLYATGSEDGTIKMWKSCAGPFGLWRSD